MKHILFFFSFLIVCSLFTEPALAAPIIEFKATPLYNAQSDTVTISYIASKDKNDKTSYQYSATIKLTRKDGQPNDGSDPQYFQSFSLSAAPETLIVPLKSSTLNYDQASGITVTLLARDSQAPTKQPATKPTTIPITSVQAKTQKEIDLGFQKFYENLPPLKYKTFPELMNALFATIETFRAFVIFMGIIIAGIMYITASGDDEKAKKARQYLKWMIIAMLILLLFLIGVQAIQNFLARFLQQAAGLPTSF